MLEVDVALNDESQQCGNLDEASAIARVPRKGLVVWCGNYGVLQEGILCDVFSQKCSAAWQGARAERLTVSVMLPDRQDADDWLNFMLS